MACFRPASRPFLALACLLALAACSESEPTRTAAVAEDDFWLRKEAPSPFRTYDAATFFTSTSYVAPSAAGYAFSPDGDRVLVSSDASGVFHAQVVERATGSITSLTNRCLCAR